MPPIPAAAFAPGSSALSDRRVPYYDQDACDAAGWSAEQSLDVEAVHGFAPDAN